MKVRRLRLSPPPVAALLATLCSAVAAALAVPAAAQAAFPGRNGRIASEEVCQCDQSATLITSVSPSGAGLRTLVDFNPDPGFNGRLALSPAYSPRGDKLAYQARDHDGPSRIDGLWTKVLRRGARSRHLPRTGRRDGDPAWSPGGRRLVYTSAHRRGTNIRVYRGGRSRRLTWGLEPTWSSRGRIAFSRLRGPRPGGENRHAIYVMRGDGSHVRRVVAGSNPDWSPHGSWIAFSRRDGGIGLVRPDGSGERRLTTPGPDLTETEPSFSPDGRYVVFSRSDWTLVVLRLADGQQRTIRANSPGQREWSFAENDWQPIPTR